MNQHYEVITEDMFPVLEKTLSLPIVVFDREKLQYYNTAFCLMLGYQKEEFDIQSKGCFMKAMKSSKLYRFLLEEISAKEEGLVDEFVLYKKDDTPICISCYAKILEYKGQLCIMAQLHDVTEKRRMQDNLVHLSNVRALMLEISQSVLSVGDINQIYDLILINALRCIENSQLGTIFILKGREFHIVASHGFREGIEEFCLPIEETSLYKLTDGRMDRTCCMSDISKYDRFYPINTKFGESKLIKSTITAPIRIDGVLYGMINIDSVYVNQFAEEDVKTMEFIRNNIEIAISNHLLYEKMSEMAKFDGLTQLYNRTYFYEAYERLKTDYSKKKEGFYLVIMDMNGLKRMNDCCGHLAGDRAIREVADVIKGTASSRDMVARIGGDEFCGIYMRTDVEELTKRLEESLYELRNRICCAEWKEPISFSYGIAKFPEEGYEYQDILSIADERMYQFKKNYKESI